MEIEQSGTPRRHQTTKQKRHSTHMDMTPMVDLAFLLLTFFILTTAFRNMRVVNLTVPDDTKTIRPNKITVDQAFNLVLLPDDRIQWYVGTEDMVNNSRIALFTPGTNYIGDVLREKNQFVFAQLAAYRDSVEKGIITPDSATFQLHILKIKNYEKGPVVLLKTTPGVKYQELIHAFDEINKAEIGRYAIMEMGEIEKGYFGL